MLCIDLGWRAHNREESMKKTKTLMAAAALASVKDWVETRL